MTGWVFLGGGVGGDFFSLLQPKGAQYYYFFKDAIFSDDLISNSGQQSPCKIYI